MEEELNEGSLHKVHYTINEILLMNDPSLFPKYRAKLEKFKKLLKEIQNDQKLITSFYQFSVSVLIVKF